MEKPRPTSPQRARLQSLRAECDVINFTGQKFHRCSNLSDGLRAIHQFLHGRRQRAAFAPQRQKPFMRGLCFCMAVMRLSDDLIDQVTLRSARVRASSRFWRSLPSHAARFDGRWLDLAVLPPGRSAAIPCVKAETDEAIHRWLLSR